MKDTIFKLESLKTADFGEISVLKRFRSDQELLIGRLENKDVFNLTVLAGSGTLTVNEDNADSLAHVH